ncbi:glutamate racemase [Arcobacter aquimarinus]|uniref:Glutamate racemase n=1 Tax=Arcobacter aquimarinus TaxID=1315211 RepID=A0AAE7B2B2_9BACT|nr:glutamate racemase [Arcobacter aquimarinus]QKE25116.1 glutamate racemase [Arcobacter aquimarinus]RXI36432.1 glutamate racemase [Arcobacter aquimarinus]
MKVGIFDSGLGGLTVLKSILKVFKGAEIFYIADTAYAPYGEKNSFEILERCDYITEFLLENYGIEALIVACNTATSAAIKHLREKFPFLIVIGTEPGIKPAILNTKTSTIGILATPTTLKGDKYQFLVNELSNIKKVKLYEQACVGLVEQIEKGEINSSKTFSMLENWLTPMKENGVDTIVLGCTHYPLVGKLIENIMGKDISLIETGDAIANRLLFLSEQKGHINQGELKILILHTGIINTNMIQTILEDNNIEIRKCEI